MPRRRPKIRSLELLQATGKFWAAIYNMLSKPRTLKSTLQAKVQKTQTFRMLSIRRKEISIAKNENEPMAQLTDKYGKNIVGELVKLVRSLRLVNLVTSVKLVGLVR